MRVDFRSHRSTTTGGGTPATRTHHTSTDHMIDASIMATMTTNMYYLVMATTTARSRGNTRNTCTAIL